MKWDYCQWYSFFLFVMNLWSPIQKYIALHAFPTLLQVAFFVSEFQLIYVYILYVSRLVAFYALK